jgi:hypothetical protein
MNRTLVFVVFACAVVVSIASVTVIAILRPEATGTIVNTIVVLLTVLSGFAVTAYGLIKVTDKVETVQKQTNGTLSAKDARIDELTSIILRMEREKNNA